MSHYQTPAQMLDLGGHAETSRAVSASCHLHKYCFPAFLDHLGPLGVFGHINQQTKPPTDSYYDSPLTDVYTMVFPLSLLWCSQRELGQGGGGRRCNGGNVSGVRRYF